MFYMTHYTVTIKIERDDYKTKLERQVVLSTLWRHKARKYITDKAAARKALEQLLAVI